MSIATCYDPKGNIWHREWPGCVSQHDVVYQSPPEDPMQGLPIGNGDIGALLWTEDNRLILAINKCDTWDDARQEGPFKNWNHPEEEYRTSLKHCARLVVEFPAPVFAPLYQKDFNGRLDLAGGTARLEACTPFSKVQASAFVTASNPVLALEIEAESAEATELQVTLERWGSRTFAHWMGVVNGDASIGLDGTQTSVDGNTILIRQQLRNLHFVVGARLVDGDSKARRLHQRAGRFECPGGRKKRFTVLLTVVTSENVDDPEGKVLAILNRAEVAGTAAIRAEHEAEWRAFWDAAFVDLPDDYLANIWHLNLYFANSASRGEYPPHFCNALWGFNRDFVPWNFYFHWNLQDHVWPLHAANHPELAMPYFKYRRRQLAPVMAYARKYKKAEGAFYSDVADRKGYNELDANDNNTPGAQIAMDFWRHYRYTGNEAFLREYAWPVMREVARFYTSMVRKGEDGRYHVEAAQTYEGSPLFDDPITDLAMMRALFPAAVEAAGRVGECAGERANWQEMAQNLPAFQRVPLAEDECEVDDAGGRVLSGGLGRGKPVGAGEVFAVGKFRAGSAEESRGVRKGEWMRNRYGNKNHKSYYGIPDAELAPVFPGGIIGLAHRGTPLYEAAVNQIRLHPEAKGCMSWCPYPIALARLGLAEECAAALRDNVSTWQAYCQGFGMEGTYEPYHGDLTLRWKTKSVGISETSRRVDFPQWPFRHFDYEAIPIDSCAINEMLLQSHDGIIRLCPAVPAGWSPRFKLAAVGGFVVHAEAVNGALAWAVIESRLGSPCRLVNPWPQQVPCCVELSGDGTVAVSIDLDIREEGHDILVHFATTAGRRYLLTRDDRALEHWQVQSAAFSRNTQPKTLGNARLGLPRICGDQLCEKNWRLSDRHSPFIADGWAASVLMPPADVTQAPCQGLADDLGWGAVPPKANLGCPELVQVHNLRGPDGLVYLARKVKVAEAGEWVLHVGHDGGARVFVDGKPVVATAGTVKPATHTRTHVRLALAAGEHEIVVAFDRDNGGGWGIIVSFEIPHGCDYSKRAAQFPEPVNEQLI